MEGRLKIADSAFLLIVICVVSLREINAHSNYTWFIEDTIYPGNDFINSTLEMLDTLRR